MVDWSGPALTDTYQNVLEYLKDRDESAAKQDYTGDTNVPTDAIRFSSDKWEKYNGSSWGDLSSKYLIDVDTVDGSHASDFAAASHVGAGGAAHANATTSTAGFLSGADKTIIDGLGDLVTINSPLPVANGGTGSTTASAARTALGLGDAATKTVGVANGQVPAMDATGYPAADGSQLTGLASAAGFGSAASEDVAAGGSGDLLRADGDGSSLTGLSGSLISRQVFTASGTWTRPSGCTLIVVELVAGGGGGGGSNGSNPGGGGGGGGTAKTLGVVSALASASIAIGAGGGGGAASNDGSDGGDTTFNSTQVVARGGKGGVSGATTGAGGSGGGLSPAGTGDELVEGSPGGGGFSNFGGAGGGSSVGGGSQITDNGDAGSLARVFGGGGSGGGVGANAGGGGKAGYAVVWNFT